MIIFAIVAAFVLIAFIAGAIALLRAGIIREESDHSLLGAPSTRTASLTRRVVGLHVRAPRYVIEVQDDAAAPTTGHGPNGHPCARGEAR